MSRIIMIGNALSGKTSNMLCTYGILRNALRTDSAFDGRRIFLEENADLNEDYEKYMTSCEVQATSRIRDYSFTLSVRGMVRHAEVQSYDLADVVGGFCIADTETRDYRYIWREMSDADHILMFFSCQELLPRSDEDCAKAAKNLDQMLAHLNERLEENHGRRIHLSLVFTYYDTIEEGGWEEREILSLFDGLIKSRRSDLAVEHYFVSNLPNRMDNVELPILSVLTHLAFDDVMSERGSWMARHSPSHRIRAKAVAQLCKYLERKTKDRRWSIMAGRMDDC